MAELLEQFQQLQEQLTQFEPDAHPPTHMADLMQLTDKLQHLTMTLQPYPTPKPREESMHTTIQAYTDTLQTTQRGKSHHILTPGYPHV